MPASLSAYLLPEHLKPGDLAGGIAVVIDVLRASTSIAHALAAGCESIIPCENISQARTFTETAELSPPLLAGERGGERIDGFDLDNSPASFTPATVAGRTIVFTTTNGTRALLACQEAHQTLVGSFCNASAIIRALCHSEAPVHLICAGTDGAVSSEDTLCAGALAMGVLRDADIAPPLNPTAAQAVDLYKSCHGDQGRLLTALRESRGGQNLRRLGFDSDICLAAERDRFDLVPEFEPRRGSILALQKIS